MMLVLALPEGVPAGIAAWRLPLSLDAPPSEADWRVLSADEQVSALRLRQPADRVRSVATRAALRRKLGALLDRDPAALSFVLGRQGKPALADAALTFNVSHSGAEAAIAIAASQSVNALGVDVERCDGAIDIAGMASLAFTARERAAMDREPSRAHELFFKHWVGKEAVLKAMGHGIADHLQCIDIEPRGNGWLGVRQELLPGRSLGACLLPVPSGYAAAIAWQDKEIP